MKILFEKLGSLVKNIFSSIISYLGSYKFTIVILPLIAVVALFGSLVPQLSGEAQIDRFNLIFGENGTEAFNFFYKHGLLYVYETPLFITLLVLFTTNLALCTLKLLPFMRHGYKDKPIQFTDKFETTHTVDEICEYFKRNAWRGSVYNKEFYKAERHTGGRKGVVVLHSGVLLVLLGALVGFTSGLKGYTNILEGSSDNLSVKNNGEYIYHGFDLNVDRFDIDYYDNSSRPKSFKATLSVVKDGVKVKEQVVDVNNPLKYDGFTFYQTSYGFYPNVMAKVLLYKTYDNVTDNLSVYFGQGFKVGKDIMGKVIDFAPTLIVRDNKSFPTASEEMINPAVLIEFSDREGNPLFSDWVLSKDKSSGDFMKDFGFKIDYDKTYGVQYTGLSVKKDPGTIIVYMGFLLIIFGLLSIYLLNYTVIYFRIDDDGSKRVVHYLVRKQRRYSLADPIADFFKFLGRKV